ncbi:CotH kinase family protein [Marinoscillum sp. MHG1-6]|uniref:CotH kinase family protein n=1 Tax=Marinoscillum sp. MHG1-6 TaxID=2959627 RepID=UPI0021584267|nr:CotH kinase family protein [Marinoscillum sp. MHG1-6]
MLVRLFLCIPLFWTFSGSMLAQSHWESIVLESDSWKYLPATQEPPSDWHTLGFVDDAWQTAQGGFGYGDSDDQTIVEGASSIYLRKKVTLVDASIIQELLLDIDYDDGFVCYINGIEVARSGNVYGYPPSFNASLSYDHEALLYRGLAPERFELNPGILVSGENIISVQVINISPTSTDMSARMFLQAKISGETIIYNPTPYWFEEPVSFEESNLPIFLIDTEGQTIVDEPKINARMKVINNASGVNSIYDTNYEYNAHIGIEIRGFSSQWFEKKGYTVETRYFDGTNNNVALLGLPSENDWVFHGPYSDKSLIRNVLAYHLGNSTGRWSPRTRFFELFINGEYRGVYILTERIKRDVNRVDIATVTSNDISGDELTGGYILKIGRPDDEGTWISPYIGRTGSRWVPISYVDPGYDELLPVQAEYIKQYITTFESALHGNDFKDSEKGYRAYVDVQSFLDYYLINELSRNLDAYRVSTYFYKQKDSDGGKIVMGPFWDYNLAFGNGNFFSADQTAGWVADGLGAGDDYEIPFWWDKLRSDPYFNSELRWRWNELREASLSLSSIHSFIDSCANVVSEAKTRNFYKFPILGSYVWPNAYVGNTYQDEINYLKNWINARLSWMDSQINTIPLLPRDSTIMPGYSEQPQEPLSSPEPVLAKLAGTEHLVFPNPFSDVFTLEFYSRNQTNGKLYISNLAGQIIYVKNVDTRPGVNELIIDGTSFVSHAGVYYYNLQLDGEDPLSGKIIRKR